MEKIHNTVCSDVIKWILKKSYSDLPDSVDERVLYLICFCVCYDNAVRVYHIFIFWKYSNSISQGSSHLSLENPALFRLRLIILLVCSRNTPGLVI